MKVMFHRNHVMHTVGIIALCAVVVLLSVLPFLPGRNFDGVLTAALLANICGAASVVFTPAGIAVIAYRRATHKSVSVLPLYLICVPTIALIAQLALATPLTDRSRNAAIQNSAEMIRDIEAYHARYGQYPVSLFGEWPDYSPGIVGMSQYYYEPNGEGYNLVFEQPRFLLDDIGTREFVMYNSRDEHAMTSHAARRLNGDALSGWYKTGDTGHPHWKYFLFD